jgi:hypothetical protein
LRFSLFIFGSSWRRVMRDGLGLYDRCVCVYDYRIAIYPVNSNSLSSSSLRFRRLTCCFRVVLLISLGRRVSVTTYWQRTMERSSKWRGNIKRKRRGTATGRISRVCTCLVFLLLARSSFPKLTGPLTPARHYPPQ